MRVWLCLGPERDNFRWDLKTSNYSIMRVASYPLPLGWHSPAETKGWPCSSLLSSIMVLEVRKLRSSFEKLVSSQLTIWCCSDIISFFLWIFWPLQLSPLTKSDQFSLSQLGSSVIMYHSQLWGKKVYLASTSWSQSIRRGSQGGN